MANDITGFKDESTFTVDVSLEKPLIEEVIIANVKPKDHSYSNLGKGFKEVVIANEDIESIDHLFPVIDTSDVKQFYPADTKFLKIDGSAIQNHTATLRLKCKTKEEFMKWLKEHHSLSGVTFRVGNSRHVNGKTVVYKSKFRCQHNTIPGKHGVKNPSKKHTGCGSQMLVTINTSPTDRKMKTKDKFRKQYPTIVKVKHIHNHGINDEESLRYRDPVEEVQNRIIELIKIHTSPAAALHAYRQELQEKYQDNFTKVAADNSICPRREWVYNLYYRHRDEFGNSLCKKVRVKGSKTKRKRKVKEKSNSLPKLEITHESSNSLPANESEAFECVESTYIGNEAADTMEEEIENEEEVLEKVKEEIEETINLLKHLISTNPLLFAEPVASLRSSLMSMGNDPSLLVSALHQFGKTNHNPLDEEIYTITIPGQPITVRRREDAVKAMTSQYF